MTLKVNKMEAKMEIDRFKDYSDWAEEIAKNMFTAEKENKKSKYEECFIPIITMRQMKFSWERIAKIVNKKMGLKEPNYLSVRQLQNLVVKWKKEYKFDSGIVDDLIVDSEAVLISLKQEEERQKNVQG